MAKNLKPITDGEAQVLQDDRQHAVRRRFIKKALYLCLGQSEDRRRPNLWAKGVDAAQQQRANHNTSMNNPPEASTPSANFEEC